MLQSKLFPKTLREAPKDETSVNSQFLIRGGFVDKLMAGVYTYQPLGLRVFKKIENIIREEINKIGGQEVMMPALHPKENWQTTGRWDDLDALFKVESRYKAEYALGPTHEEIIVPLAKKAISSYKDLPLYLYQIQVKFRDEPRAKSGLLRGREFTMKDLYSFHTTEDDLWDYYEKAKKAYFNIFSRCGLESICAEASGGTFSKYSHEFQVFNEVGEDTIYYCSACGLARNKEIVGKQEEAKCPKCGQKWGPKKGIEVGNIFPLKTKYSEPFDLKFVDEKGQKQTVIMGCYGIGLDRTLGTIVEVHHDDQGIVWPLSVAPFQVHLLGLDLGKNSEIKKEAEKLYNDLIQQGLEVLFDDRTEASAGEKFADADLIGIPVRLLVSAKSLSKGGVEVKLRKEKGSEVVAFEKVGLKISEVLRD